MKQTKTQNDRFNDFTKRARYYKGDPDYYVIIVAGKTLRADSPDTLYEMYLAELKIWEKR